MSEVENEEVFLGVMNHQEAKNHLACKAFGVKLNLKSNDQTCTTGCTVTVEVWAESKDAEKVQAYFHQDYLKHVKGHEPKVEHLMAVFDPSMSEVICQACGAIFKPDLKECPDCGLCY
jgi:hypothetical protein